MARSALLDLYLCLYIVWVSNIIVYEPVFPRGCALEVLVENNTVCVHLDDRAQSFFFDI